MRKAPRNVLLACLLVASSIQTGAADPGSVRALRVPATATVESVPMILDAAKIPTDPGEAGKASLAGVDSNANGVRDDAERWIAETFPTCAGLRAALSQVALVVQRKIVVPEMTEEAKERIAVEEGSAIACFAAVSDSCPTMALEKFIDFSMLLQNTQERSRAYLRVLPKLKPISTGECMISVEALHN